MGRRKIAIDSIKKIDPRTSTEPLVLNAFREEIEAAGGPISVATEEE